MPDGDPARLELLDVGAADRIGAGLVELLRIERADVVCLERGRVEHPGRCYGFARAQRAKTCCARSSQTANPPASRKLQPPAWISSGIVS